MRTKHGRGMIFKVQQTGTLHLGIEGHWRFHAPVGVWTSLLSTEVSVPWATWAWVSACCHILATLQIPPNVTEKWNDSMKISWFPWQPERLLVLAASKIQDKHWLRSKGMREVQGSESQKTVLVQKIDPEFFTQMKWSQVVLGTHGWSRSFQGKVPHCSLTACTMLQAW